MDVHLSIRIGHADTDVFSGRRDLSTAQQVTLSDGNRWGRDLLHDRWLGSYHLVYRLQLSDQRG